MLEDSLNHLKTFEYSGYVRLILQCDTALLFILVLTIFPSSNKPNIISVWKVRLLGTETSLHQEKEEDRGSVLIVREVKEMKE